MSRPPILKPGEPYSFARYFELPYEPEDILAELGVTLTQSQLTFNLGSIPLDRLQTHRDRLHELRPYISLTSEAARREVLIAPVLMDLVHYTHAKLRIEYPIAVSDRLKGTLDYYLQTDRACLVVEAKNADLNRGFTQLAVELIALDQWTDDPSETLTGAVTTGDLWRFGVFHRRDRSIVQDLTLYQIPDHLETLFRILISILS
jgi:hypothetical protein